jgi:chromosome partitioning protein
LNPTEIYQFLITLIRAGAEVIAASLIALGAGMALGWWATRKFFITESRRLKRRSRELETQVNEIEAKRSAAEKQLELTRENLALTTKALEDAQKARDESRQENTSLRHRVETLQRERDEEHRECTKAVLELDHTRARFQEAVKEKDEATSQLQPLINELISLRTIVANAQESRQALLRKIAVLDRHLTEKTKEVETLTRQLADALAGGNEIERKLGDALNEIGRLKQIADQQDEELDLLKEVLDSIGKLSGKVWTRPLPADAPRFVPLGEKRRCRIISLLNLKGGVGKTTITLNLAAALSDQGKRVLLVDCDHQRSLTNLCLRPSKRNESHKAGRTLQRYLLGPTRSAESFLHAVQPLPNMNQASIVINTASGDGTEGEGLAYVEEKVMLDWLMAPQDTPDIRFALRLALHNQAIRGQYDYILLDCPPRFSTACINAIAAADFILIPLLLDEVSATVPLIHVLTELKKLHETALPDWKILGVIANRFAGVDADRQSKIWEALDFPARHAWGQDVYRFPTMIRQAVAYSQAAKILAHDSDTAVAIWQNAEAKRVFYTLVDEIEERIAHESQRPSAVPS